MNAFIAIVFASILSRLGYQMARSPVLPAFAADLGAVPEIALHRAFTRFEPGAILVMYSDGLLERRNNDDEEFGLSRLEKLIVQHQEKSAPKILEIIYQTVFAFGNQAKWQDDVTAVVVKKSAS